MSQSCIARSIPPLLTILVFLHLPAVLCSSWYVSTLAGSDNGFQDGIGSSAQFRGPSGLCLAARDGASFLFVSDSSNHRIRAINLEDGFANTIAGSGAFFGGFLDGVGTNSQFNAPGGLTFSNLQNKIFIADSLNHRIRSISLNGTVVETAAGAPENVLGTFVGGYLDGRAELARFNAPKSVAMSRDTSNVFIADTNNHRIRVLELETRQVWTLAGLGIPGAEDGNATAAQFSSPAGVAVSPDGLTVFVADTWNHRIRAISLLKKTVTTLSGSAQLGGGFRDGSAADALFRQPAALLVMESGDSVLVGDTGNGRLRLIDVLDSGSVSTLAGNGENKFRDGLGSEALLASPSGLTASASESTIFVSDFWNDRVRVMALCTSNRPPFSRYTGRVAPFLGTACGWVCENGYYQTATLSCRRCSATITSAEHTGPGSAVDDPSSCPWQCAAGSFLAGGAACAPCTTTQCAVGEYRETCTPSRDGQCVPCTNKPPHSHYTDHGGGGDDCPFECDGGYSREGGECKDGTFWVARAIAGGVLGTGSVDGTGTWALFNRPNGISSARGSTGDWFVDVADTDNHLIRRINVLSEAVSTIAGSGARGHLDGDSSAAKFNAPVSVATAAGARTVFVADKENHLIRVIDLVGGQVTSLAGRSMVAGFRDGAASNALFNRPSCVALHPDGQHVLVSDAENHRIRMANIGSGEVSTLAGSGDRGGWLDASGTSARFFLPGGLAVSEDHSLLYVADRLNSRLRAVNLSSGAVATVSGGQAGFSDGRVSAAQMDSPVGLVALNGSVLFADRWNHRVRSIEAVSGYMTTLLLLRFGRYGTASEAGDIAVSVGGRAVIVSDGDSSIWMLLRCSEVADSGSACPTGEHKGVCGLDDPQVTCTPCTNYKPSEAFYTGPGFPATRNNCPWTCRQGSFVSRTSLFTGPQLITQHLVLPFYIETSPSYEVSFDVKLLGISTDWRYILGLSATYLGCCAYGDRIPLIAVHPLDSALRVVVGGKDGDGNLMCPYKTPPLPLGTWNRVSVVVTDHHATTYINGSAVSDACLLGARDYHQNVRVDLGGETSTVETVDSLGAELANVTYSQLHCKSCPTSPCTSGYYRGVCDGFKDGACRECTAPSNVDGLVYFTSPGESQLNNCAFASCNVSSCGVGEYRTACGHVTQSGCAGCMNTIPVFSSFSGPADPPANATSCPYACWSGFYLDPQGGSCIPEGAGEGQLGNVSLDNLDVFFGYRPSVTFEATMRYSSARLDDIIQIYREAVAFVAQVEMRFVLVVKVEDVAAPNATVIFVNSSTTSGRRATFLYIRVTTRVWTEQGMLGELEARLTEEALNRELVEQGLPLVFLDGVPTEEEYRFALERFRANQVPPSTPPSSHQNSRPSRSQLSTGAIAGIVLSVLFAIALFAVAVFVYHRRRLRVPPDTKAAKIVPLNPANHILNKGKSFGEGVKHTQVDHKRSGSGKASKSPEHMLSTPLAWSEDPASSETTSPKHDRYVGGSFKEPETDKLRRAHTMKEGHSRPRPRSTSPEPQRTRRVMRSRQNSSEGIHPAQEQPTRQPADLRRADTARKATCDSPLVDVGWGSFRVQLS